MHISRCFFMLTLSHVLLCLATVPIEVVFLISGHESSSESPLANRLQESISRQSLGLRPHFNVRAHILNEIFNYPGQWSILQLVPNLVSASPTGAAQQIDNGIELISDTTRWIVLCEERTRVNVPLLLKSLSKENHTQALLLGHALYDRESTIIHHFAFYEDPRWFPYPLLAAGIIFSQPLLRSIAEVFLKRDHSQWWRSEFSIDAAHELAQFIYDNVPEDWQLWDGTQKAAIATHPPGEGPAHPHWRKVIMKKAPYICPSANRSVGMGIKPECAMHAESPSKGLQCKSVSRDQVFFAVKTCSKFHKDRLPVIRDTWAPYAKHIKFYSDIEDETMSTINVGIPNVRVGHCSKTLEILKLALLDIEHHNRVTKMRPIEWLLLVDDDTLLSVAGICQVLGCHDPNDHLYLGERYGYRLHAPDGFNYITGGGGIAFSLPTVELVVERCLCPTASAPDDMVLGSCLNSLQVPAKHSPRFHQARPNDYAVERLRMEEPVSFHKFWQLDPVAVYRHWFFEDDDRLLLMEAREVLADEDVPGTNNPQKIGHLLKHPDMSSIVNLVPVSFAGGMQRSQERHIDL